MMEQIDVLGPDRVAWIDEQFVIGIHRKPTGYFAACMAAQTRDELVLLLAREGENLLGYLKVVWQPGYLPFREQGIPEVQDLNVMPNARRHGVASRLMDRTEALIATRSAIAGIGVGLHPGYGPAQRMYVLRGYVPDGLPLTYNGIPVHERQTVMLDDDLVLHLTKRVA
ncbi:MAG TPA: GNAT family N-acetyltransferase [Anaerolineae bacterium]|jgi:GNAT superfamily N-acetyltransferase